MQVEGALRGVDRRLLIGGERVDAENEATLTTSNPATGEPLAEIPLGSPVDVHRAVVAARDALEGQWAGLAPRRRGRLLWELAAAIDEAADELATLESLDNGKPWFESRRVDMPLAAEVLRYYSGWSDKLHGEVLPVGNGALDYTLRQPVGVVGAIVPWNFPLLLVAWKLGPALAAGNTVVLKPAPETSLTALRLADLVAAVGLPAGVVNIVTGDGTGTGSALVDHPGVDKIAFTGSTATGREIMRRCAAGPKRLTLELGGKSPNVVFEDADLDAAARGAVTGIFYGKGEVCAAGSRLLVQRSVLEPLLERLLERVDGLTVGDPFASGTRIGPLVSEAQLRRVQEYVALGLEEGARLRCGGGRAEVGDLGGYFFQPTVLDNVDNRSRVAREEIFGPVLAVIAFDTEEEAVSLANDNPYGLAAGVWSRDIGRAHRVAARIRAGTVWVNTYNEYDPAAPFGGIGASGFGRELGAHALQHYTQVKNVWVRLD